MNKFLKRISILIFLLIVVVFFSNYIIKYSAKGKIYNDANKIPKNETALVLGTGKFLKNGYINLYYKYRIEATIKLYKAGKIKNVLISGDNSRKTYDEPSMMKDDLIKAGIPANRIYLDYAGFRTLDSVVRSKAIFGQNRITIISQKFHNERAVFIANNKNIEAIAFNAKDVSSRYGLKTRVREYFARVKAILDIIIGEEPKFYGKKIVIS